MDRPENRGWIDNCTHNACKITIYFWSCQKKYVSLQPNSNFYVRKVNEKTKKKCWQPSWYADDDIVHQYGDGAGVIGNDSVLRAYLAQSLCVGEGESDRDAHAERRGERK